MRERARRGTVLAPQLADDALMASISAGDLTGLGEIFDRYGDDVRRLLGRLGVASDDVDDLVQQTFLDVPRAASRFRQDARIKPWLYGLAAMVARRHRRALVHAVVRMRRWAFERVAECPTTPAEELELGTEARRARRALEALAPKKREAFVLVALEGMSGEEAAAALGIPVATVWTRLHHARRELNRALVEA